MSSKRSSAKKISSSTRRFVPPPAVRAEAKKGLVMRKNGYEGATSTGWARGAQLAAAGSVDESTIRTMKAWFARHNVTSKPGYDKWKKDGSPVALKKADRNKRRGAVAYLLWGGDSARKWVDKINV